MSIKSGSNEKEIEGGGGGSKRGSLIVGGFLFLFIVHVFLVL